MEVTLRAATWDDFTFLKVLHESAMKEYVARTWGWNQALQDQHFAQNFDPEILQLILADGEPAGYLSLKRMPESMHLAAIALAPQFQNRGIGSALLKCLLESSATEGLQMDLQVLKVNPAKKLYERLGFHVCAETDTHFQMTTAARRDA